MDYATFLERKLQVDPPTGLSDLPTLPDCLFDFQADIVRWALRRGRAALFAGTGLGKTLMALAWARAVHEATGGDVLILTPLAVASQFVREADKFGIEARQCARGDQVEPGVTVTNYQKLDHFDLSRFTAVVLDESSILKAYDGKTRTYLINACQQIPFRLAATATPAPNDFMELGNHAEFLGVMSYTDMLATFFTHDGGETQKWRLKGHAEGPFWRWMCSWAVMLRHPKDLGYADQGFDLPPLRQHQHTVDVEYRPSMDTGMLFPIEARTMQERIGARKDTIAERVEQAFYVVTGRRVSDKLAECGSQNTPSDDAKSTSPTPQSGSGARSRGGHPKRTRNTCVNTGQRSRKNSNERASNKTRLTQIVANATPAIQSSRKSVGNDPAKETGNESATLDCGQTTASAPLNMTPCSLVKAKGVLSATAYQAMAGGGLPSTIATKPDRCVASSAGPATKRSDNSETISTGSTEPSNTCSCLVSEPWVIWCGLNAEQDALERTFGSLAISIRGTHTEEKKEALHQDWLAGKAPILITKCSMFGHGLNWQHCRNTLFVGLNDSFEQVYQAVRRFWRFGQTKPVNVHFIAAETEGAVVTNIRRKEADAERMAKAMVQHMTDLSSQEIRGTVRERPDYQPTQPVRLPVWIEGEAA